MLELGKCGCYSDLRCYADCDCSHCTPHKFVGVILGGKRYFQVKDFRPDNPKMMKMIVLQYSSDRNEPSVRVRASDLPDMLIAAESATISAKDATLALTTKKVEAASDEGTLPDPTLQ